MFMISLPDFFVFLVAASIVATYVAIVHHFLQQAGAAETENAPATATLGERHDETHGQFVAAHSH